MTNIICELTAYRDGSAVRPRLDYKYETTFTIYLYVFDVNMQSLCK